MEPEVAVAPVERPRRVRDGVAEAGDREAGPVPAEVLTLWSAPLDDREVSRGDLAFHDDLVAGAPGHPNGAPALYSCDVEVRYSHPFTGRPPRFCHFSAASD